MAEVCRVVGSAGSPYSMKMRAIFRYRRIPHIWEHRSGRVKDETADVRPLLIPMVKFPDGGDWRVDSTPIAYELEERYSERSILPPDPVHRFLAELIEDMADEWLTKVMFHYRWYYEPDQAFAAWWIASDGLSADSVPRAEREVFAHEFGQRQIERMGIVGCTEDNKPVIEETYRRILEALETRCGLEGYLFGTRPALADFGLFGQLKTLGDDPTPRAEMSRISPTVLHWIRQTDDLSGNDGEWFSTDTELPEAVTELLQVCGEAYLPFLAANMRALEVGREEVTLSIFSKPYAQSPFRYQGKCYSRLRSLYGRLEGGEKQRADALLEPAGCIQWLDNKA